MTKTDEKYERNIHSFHQNNYPSFIIVCRAGNTVLMEHLEKDTKNAKMVLWQIQNDIIECLSEFLRSKIKYEIPDYYAIIADEITDRFSNKDILLLYLRYVRFFTNQKPFICKIFFDSLRIQGRPTGQTIRNTILLLLQRNGINLSKSHDQAYDGASAMSSKASGAVSVIRKEQPLPEYTHCRNHKLNLAISYACKNQSMKKFMDNLTSVCNFFENSPKRQKYFECFLEFYKVELNLPEAKWKEIIGLAKTRWVER